MNNNDRYKGKPLLRLLECYVLWSINALPAKDMENLNKMTPKLESIYKVQGTWHEIVAASVNLPPQMPKLIQDQWSKNTTKAQSEGIALSPQMFAEVFVDQHLA